MFEEMLIINDQNYQALTYLGQIYLKQDELKKSDSYLKMALKINKEFPLVTMGNLLFAAGNIDQAGKFYRQALKINNLDIEANIGLGNIH